MVLLFVVCGWREEAVAGVFLRIYSVHSTYVFFCTRATKVGKIGEARDGILEVIKKAREERHHVICLPCTEGFARNRDIVALVQKKTYVECTEYVRRHTPATASSRQPQTTNKRTMAVASGFCGF